METKKVEMTAQEIAEFEAFKKEKEKKEQSIRYKANREIYYEMIDKQVRESFVKLQSTSESLKESKEAVLNDFKAILEMKEEVLKKVKETQRSHTFTTSDGKMRITIGSHVTDSWKDTVNDGIAMVKEACMSLIKDDTTKALVNQIMRLIAKDSAGNLKAAKAIQLRKLANELNNDMLTEGITIIEEAYIPSFSKTYVYAERRSEKDNAWVTVPLSMTEV